MALVTLFSPSSNDQSIYYLSQIFPGLNQVLYGTTGQLNIIGELFLALNSIVLTVAGFVITYTIVMGLIATAHEGEFLGKKYDKVWTPLRIVMGIAGLVPTTYGYSGIQFIMMWVIVQGIGVGDLMWTTTLSYVQQFGTVMNIANVQPNANSSGSSINTDDPAWTQNFQNLFSGLVCQESAARSYASPDPKVSYYCSGSTDPFCGVATSGSNALTNLSKGSPLISVIPNPGGDPLTPNVTAYNMGPPIGSGSCGQLTFCDNDPNSNLKSTTNGVVPDPGKLAMCQAQQQILQSIVITLDQIASQLVDMDYKYQVFYNNSYQIAPPVKGVTFPPPAIPYKVGSLPSWMTAYCSSISVPTDACCVPQSGNDAITNAQEVFGAGCAVDLAHYNSTNGAVTQNPQLVSSIYWPYGFNVGTPPVNSVNFISAVYAEYGQAMKNAAIAYNATQLASGANLTGTFLTSQQNGWILAGALYFLMAEQNNANNDVTISMIFETTAPTATTEPSGWTNLDAASTLLTQQPINPAAPASSGTTNNPTATTFTMSYSGNTSNPIMNIVNPVTVMIVNNFWTLVNAATTNEPIVQIQSLGHNILTWIETVFWVILAAIPVAVAVGAALTTIGLGTGVPGLVEIVMSIVLTTIPVVFVILTAFLVAGGMMAVYVPLIPFIIFTAGGVGWLISVIEAMVAGPLVALGIISPNAHGHEILGKAEAAIGLLFSIFLRPGLMVFGMVLGMLLAAQLVIFVNTGFKLTLGATSAQNSPGLFESMFYIGAYVMVIVGVINKCFSLIYVIPQKTLQWIAIQAAQQDTQQDLMLSELKSGVEAGGSAGKQTLGAGDKATSTLGKMGQAYAQKRKEGMGGGGDGGGGGSDATSTAAKKGGG